MTFLPPPSVELPPELAQKMMDLLKEAYAAGFIAGRQNVVNAFTMAVGDVLPSSGAFSAALQSSSASLAGPSAVPVQAGTAPKRRKPQPERAPRGSVPTAVDLALGAHQDGIKGSQIAEWAKLSLAIEIQPNSVMNYLRKLEQAGRAYRRGEFWFVTKNAAEAPSEETKTAEG